MAIFMKTRFLLLALLQCTAVVLPQSAPEAYPDPEFTNEICNLKKEGTLTTMRLEKETSKMDTKTRLGGYEMGYTMEGLASPARLTDGNNLSFIYSTTDAGYNPSPAADSIIKANGMDPAMMGSMMGRMNDPSNMISLYRVVAAKGKRKILVQSIKGGIMGAKDRSSDKYTFSVKPIKPGYWELVVDKALPKGEYAFTMMNPGMGNMDGNIQIFAFGVD